MRHLFLVAIVGLTCAASTHAGDISAREARRLASTYMLRYVSGCGGVEESIPRGSMWEVPVRFGFAEFPFTRVADPDTLRHHASRIASPASYRHARLCDRCPCPGSKLAQDHARRGLVVLVPNDTPDAETLDWLLKAGTALASHLKLATWWRDQTRTVRPARSARLATGAAAKRQAS